jgi:hypothetical protein
MDRWRDLALALRSSHAREPLKLYLEERLSRKTDEALNSGNDVVRGRALELRDLLKEVFDPIVDKID